MPLVPADSSRTADDVGGATARTLPRSIVVLLGIAGVVAMGVGIKAAAGIVAPAVLALVLTIAVLPVGRWARSHRWPGWLATLAALVAAYLILLVMVVGLVVCLIKFADLLPTYAAETKDLTRDVEDGLAQVGLSTSATSDALSKVDLSKLAEVPGRPDLEHPRSARRPVLPGHADVLLRGRRSRLRAARRGPPRHQARLTAALGKFVRGSQTYLLMTALFGAIVGVLDAGALWLLGVPLPLVWGFFSFLTNFIPNIGFVIGVIPPALLALLDGGWEAMLWVIVAYSLLNVTIQTFIQPRIVGNSVGLSAEITFISLVVWTFLLGALGALLAVPMTLLLRAIFIDADDRASWVAPLIDAQVADEKPVADQQPDG